jgi:hypothetical protein
MGAEAAAINGTAHNAKIADRTNLFANIPNPKTVSANIEPSAPGAPSPG